MNRSVLALLTLCLSVPSADLGAQILSPGQLAEAHAHLEGIRQCTSCHELGQRGISPDRCLACHTPLATRVEEGQGFHASVAGQTCSDCHKDHYGRDFDLRRLDDNTFVHGDTGYDLEGGHTDADCADCHTPEHIDDPEVVAFKTEHEALDRTYLGVSRVCVTCHQADDPHEGQFEGQSCEDCHDTQTWEEAPRFDHQTTAYPLEGRHLQVDCADCHVPSARFVTYESLEHGSCDSCHEDPHGGRMSGTCSSCHQTEGWRAVSRSRMERVFDHAATTFPLVGAHDSLACEACHTQGRPPVSETIRITYRPGTVGNTFPTPVSDGCVACHVPYHPGAVQDAPHGQDCADCHTEGRWAPTTYRIGRHNDEAAFALTGAHAATPCTACHVQTVEGRDTVSAHEAPRRFALRLERWDCAACHGDESPHDDVFGTRTCDVCHGTDGFDVDQFDHEADDLAELVQTCTSCHDGDDPHQDQFADRQCGACHVTSGYAIADFDHDGTAFPLDGAHESADCASCHLAETTGDGGGFIRYRPLGRECTDCHGVSL